MGAPTRGASGWPGGRAPIPVFLATRMDPETDLRPDAGAPAAGRRAGSTRLVHGEQWTLGADECESLSTRRAPFAGAADLRDRGVDRRHAGSIGCTPSRSEERR